MPMDAAVRKASPARGVSPARGASPAKAGNTPAKKVAGGSTPVGKAVKGGPGAAGGSWVGSERLERKACSSAAT